MPPLLIKAQSQCAYETLSALIAAVGEHERFWWKSTASILARMMGCCGYSVHETYFYLAFYLQVVLQALGPRPQHGDEPFWRSFMTDDLSPIEYSWNFTAAKSTVRFVIEPISPVAGTPRDPFNQIAPKAFLDHINPLATGMDLRWYRQFADTLYVKPNGCDNARRGLPEEEHPSQAFVGFDLDQRKVVAKVYMITTVKAAETGIDPIDLMTRALQKLEVQGARILDAWGPVRDYISSKPSGSSPRVEMVSFDCVQPQSSRIKIYVRSPHMSLAVAKEMFTLNGRIGADGETKKTLEMLGKLWRLSLGIPWDAPEDDELKPVDNSNTIPRTRGVIYNYELVPGNAEPEPKLYIPVRHYARSDQSVAEGLAAFRSQGWQKYADSYVTSVKEIFPQHPLETTTGTQTYISFAYKKAQGAYVSVYYSPRVFQTASFCQCRI